MSAFFIRFYGINWDQGFHLHPDERMLIMVAERIKFFSNLNPDFFNYGSLPIYLLRIIAPNGHYDSLLISGRILSVGFDLLTIILIYRIGQLLFKKNKISLLSSLLYTVAFFPIQNSHFFVVDVFLNTFVTGLIYILLVYSKSPSIKKAIILGLVFAAMMATKFTAIIFLPIIIVVILWKTMKQWKNSAISLITFHFSLLTFYFLFMPYAFIQHQQFFVDLSTQLKMNSNPYIFPYTLQYVGTVPYLYYLKNIFFWGLGPIFSILSIVGLYQISKSKNILFLIFYFLYFLAIGRSAVKFMRYMLPLYPFFALLAGYGLYKIYERNKLFAYMLVTCILLWSFTFINIYSLPHTRIAATEWILKNVPEGAAIATEHWDDGMPLYGGEKYLRQELTLYDQPDGENKWKILDEKLRKTDYIIIASNRLYIPLQKLNDCKKYKSCYPITSKYYQKLFSEKLGFKKVAEFTTYPKLEIGNWKLEIRDDVADESFTVYDHPKIMIFKKNEKNN
ncbi:MAG: Tetratricopeptide [Candidatus Roizmanbacteria bacterium GW2011_GWC2_34_23]|uniref:Tetratricopeptide n=1 Tax=Candidatus Roizmanbacteria bacterium GW2011_GWC2_34_23 TaxID=1618484 RepID=A0A0G0AVZ5_9BACT|nr:MAG: Tetratricopeptide [Candidatus Roizmanbacteria bacterium GW2011_GWC2_34_23]